VAVTGHGACDGDHRTVSVLDELQVPVVAQSRHGSTDGGVHVTVGEVGVDQLPRREQHPRIRHDEPSPGAPQLPLGAGGRHHEPDVVAWEEPLPEDRVVPQVLLEDLEAAPAAVPVAEVLVVERCLCAPRPTTAARARDAAAADPTTVRRIRPARRSARSRRWLSSA
jgi:hypothetical protein